MVYRGRERAREREKERERERERGTERLKEIENEREANSYTNSHTVTNPRSHIEFILERGADIEANPVGIDIERERGRERDRGREREPERRPRINSNVCHELTHMYVTNSHICHRHLKKAMWRIIPVENRYIYGKLV